MTSKNSFWASLRENNKRRTWLWAISWLFFLLYYIAGTALVISSKKSYLEGIEQVRQVTDFEKHQILIDAVNGFLGSNIVLMLVAAALAVICAMQGFSYLYYRKKVDMYHSLPVKKSSRFIVIWVNGVMIYLIPSFVGIAAGILVAVSQGVMTAATFYVICNILITTLLLYLGLYNLSIIAVMLTGHPIITIFGVAVLQGYEFVVKFLLLAYKQDFFEKLGLFNNSRLGQAWWSPYSAYALIWTQASWADAMKPLGRLVFLGLLFFIIAYLCYWKRPAEAAGRAMAFEITKPIIKIGIVVPAVLAAALVIKQTTSGYEHNAASGSPWFIAFAILASAAIVCCLMEVIYEFDIKACLRKKKDILICVVLATVIFLGFRFDVTGFDTYIPKPQKLESYAFVMDTGENQYIDEAGNYMSGAAYADKNMFITDAEAICRLAEIQPEEDPDEWILVKYRLKNGRSAERNIWLDYNNPETDVLLNRIVSSAEYKKGAFMIMSDSFDRWLAGSNEYTVTARYSVGPYSYKLSTDDMYKLTELYRQDLEYINYNDLSQTLPIGKINLEAYKIKNGEKSYYSYNYQTLIVYQDCVRTIACLKELGFYQEDIYNKEDVEQVVVTNYNFDTEEAETDTALYYGGEATAVEAPNRTRSVSYTTLGEIQEVGEFVWPTYWGYGNRYRELLDNAFEVTVYFKKGTNPYEHDCMSYTYRVLKDKVPNFIREVTAYIPE